MMKFIPFFRIVISGSLLMVSLGSFPVPAHAAQIITSSPFSLYYGYDNVGSNKPGWVKVSGPSSTGTTQGDFTLAPTITSAAVSDYGFIFTNGTPTYQEAQYAFSAKSETFDLSITGSYSGPSGGNNAQVKLVITNISIYGVSFDNQVSSDMAFQETTLGHTAASSSVSLKKVPVSAANLRPLNNYIQLSWDPDDFFTAGTSQSRSFTLTPGRIVDGLVIEGYLEYSYDAIPEPSTAMLGFFGGGAALFATLRRRKH